MDPRIDALARREIDRLNAESLKRQLSIDEADLVAKYTKIIRDNDAVAAAQDAAKRPYEAVTDAVLIEQVTALRDSGVIRGPKSVENAE